MGLAGELDLAGVRRLRTRDDLDKGGLPASVLAGQAVHVAGSDFEGHVVERLHTAEPLGDVPRGEHDRACHGFHGDSSHPAGSPAPPQWAARATTSGWGSEVVLV